MHVDLEDHAPAPQRVLEEGLVDRGRGVVHEDVDRAAQRRHGLGHDPVAVVGVGEVRDDDRDLASVALASARPSPARLPARSVVVVERAGDDRDVGAFGRESLGDARRRCRGSPP